MLILNVALRRFWAFAQNRLAAGHFQRTAKSYFAGVTVTVAVLLALL